MTDLGTRFQYIEMYYDDIKTALKMHSLFPGENKCYSKIILSNFK